MFSMLSINMTFDNEASLLFFLQNRHFLDYKCVSIQNSTWILSHAQLRNSSTLAHTYQLAANATLPHCCSNTKTYSHAQIVAISLNYKWQKFLNFVKNFANPVTVHTHEYVYMSILLSSTFT